MIAKPGDILSFSAGNPINGGLSYRVIQPASDRVGHVLTHHPHLANIMAGRVPLVMGCYPTFLGFFSSSVFVDTYLRPSVLERALNLAAQQDLAPILISQPLIIADMLRRCTVSVHRHTRPMIVAMGGYACPQGLEAYMKGLLPEGSVILHGYGMAEVGFASLIGTRQASGQVGYRLVDPDVEIVIHENNLGLAKSLDGERRLWHTGDQARSKNGLYEIQPGRNRVSETVWRELEGWDERDWTRKTGHLSAHSDGLRFQLRSGQVREAASEVDFYDFARDHGMTWFDKPNWSA